MCEKKEKGILEDDEKTWKQVEKAVTDERNPVGRIGGQTLQVAKKGL
jgi:hypothetical protein